MVIIKNLPGTSFRLPDARRRAKVPTEAREAVSTEGITAVFIVIVVVAGIVEVVLPYQLFKGCARCGQREFVHHRAVVPPIPILAPQKPAS